MRQDLISTAVALVAIASMVQQAGATERRFTYTYGSDVLNRGAVELESWTTMRLGRADFYRRFDHRIELEVGVTDRLQSAWYLNFTGLARDVGKEREAEFEWKGVSWEWKYKLADPVASPLGFALYFEPGFAPSEAELEAKVIVDRRNGPWYGAANVTLEEEWEFEAEETEAETALELDLGITRFVTPDFTVGVEVRNHNEIVEGEWEHSALFAGPAVSYAQGAWWSTVTVLPQLTALKGESKDGLVLDEHERVEVRVLWGIHL